MQKNAYLPLFIYKLLFKFLKFYGIITVYRLNPPPVSAGKPHHGYIGQTFKILWRST